ncbi:MAG: hypothetical protein RSD67_05530 [Oscillospiraceae bacterium]
MAIVAVYHIGNATVSIADDCIERDPVKRQKIMDDSYAMSMRYLYNLPQDKLDEYVDYMEEKYGSEYVAEYRAHQKEMKENEEKNETEGKKAIS